MNCVKKTPRTIFNMLTIYDCTKCIHKSRDERIVIGTNALYIYCINGCDAIAIEDDLIFINDKLKLLLRDFCFHQNNNILLWLDSIEPLENYDLCLSLLFAMKMNIHLIKW